MDKYKFGEFIYQKRKALGLTQDELGRRLGVTNKAVSKWEVGETLPDVTIIRKLAEVLEVTVDELLTQTNVKEEQKKVSKINKLLLILVIVLSVMTIGTIISSICYINYYKNLEEEFVLNEENYRDIIKIDPMTSFICDGQAMIITSTYELNNKYYLKEEDVLNFVILYEINYYYYDQNDKLCIVSYYERTQNITFNTEENKIEIVLTVTPKTEIQDFKCFKNVDVDYTILEYEGVVYKSK